jgi:hypothetical protein
MFSYCRKNLFRQAMWECHNTREKEHICVIGMRRAAWMSVLVWGKSFFAATSWLSLLAFIWLSCTSIFAYQCVCIVTWNRPCCCHSLRLIVSATLALAFPSSSAFINIFIFFLSLSQLFCRIFIHTKNAKERERERERVEGKVFMWHEMTSLSPVGAEEWAHVAEYF